VNGPGGLDRGRLNRGVLTRAALAILAPALLAPILVAGASGVLAAGGGPIHVRIEIEHSRFLPAAFSVPVGRPVVVELHNADPIDHEWIVGDEATHLRHATGTEPHHGSRPTEVSIDALSTVTTTLTFSTPGTFRYVCHLPGHEAYGMVGSVIVTP
jgi:plastocyanin